MGPAINLLITVTVFSTLSNTLGLSNVERKNTIATPGQNVTFIVTHHKCVFIPKPSDGHQVPPFLTVESTSTKYKVTHSTDDRCELSITNVSFPDGGVYQYGDAESQNGDAGSNGNGKHGVALLVIDENPICRVVNEVHESEGIIIGESVELQCSVSVSLSQTKPNLTISWLPNPAGKKINNELKWVPEETQQTISSSYFFNATSSAANSVRCEVLVSGIPVEHFMDDRIDGGVVKHEGHCLTNDLLVLYPARNARVMNDTSGHMNQGDKLVCYAEGWPSVSYIWTKRGVTVAEGSDLILDEIGLHQYTCLAYNTIHGSNHNSSIQTLVHIVSDDVILMAEQISNISKTIKLLEANQNKNIIGIYVIGITFSILITGLSLVFLLLFLRCPVTRPLSCCRSITATERGESVRPRNDERNNLAASLRTMWRTCCPHSRRADNIPRDAAASLDTEHHEMEELLNPIELASSGPQPESTQAEQTVSQVPQGNVENPLPRAMHPASPETSDVLQETSTSSILGSRLASACEDYPSTSTYGSLTKVIAEQLKNQKKLRPEHQNGNNDQTNCALNLKETGEISQYPDVNIVHVQQRA